MIKMIGGTNVGLYMSKRLERNESDASGESVTHSGYAQFTLWIL